MKNGEPAPNISQPPLTWPPPGLEGIQGRLWRTIGTTWLGGLLLVLPLLWAMAGEQPLWSLGPFGGDWGVGLSLALVGTALLIFAVQSFVTLMRAAGRAADRGYGTWTILEVITDASRDTGFLIQGKRHFSLMDADRRESVVRMRIRGAALLLAAGVWLAVGFGTAILLATRGFITPSGVWLMTIGPAALLLAWGLVIGMRQHTTVHGARVRWIAQEGADRIQAEGEDWAARLDGVEGIPLGSGPKGQGARFRLSGTLAVAAAVLTILPAMTVSVTGGIGAILASIALPEIRSIQEMAAAAEALGAYRLPADESITPLAAGGALQNLGFVGSSGATEAWEEAPTTTYELDWFPNPGVFPDAFTETVATDLMATALDDFTPDEQAALRQAAAHPAHEAFHLLARAELADVVTGRWTLPFPDSASYASLPWPRFAAFRTAGLAQVAKATVELSEGQRADAENTLRELVSTGYLLIEQGPTLIDNLVGLVLANMGGDALEAYYRRVGQGDRADALSAARQAAADAVRRARAGAVQEDVHSLLQGIPRLVEDEDALRGARWEYFATFNMLAPCMNLHRMVFGPDEGYDAWRTRARDALVRVPGERDLFDLAEGAFGERGGDSEGQGFLTHVLRLTLGRDGAPGRCASLIGVAGALR